jgi:hypothetical protein
MAKANFDKFLADYTASLRLEEDHPGIIVFNLLVDLIGYCEENRVNLRYEGECARAHVAFDRPAYRKI